MMSKCLKCVLVLFLAGGLRAGAQGTAFTYQGELATNGVAANGLFDFRFAVYSLGTNGTLIAGPLTNDPVGVTNGLFTTIIDFGTNVFTGPPLWLDLGVRTNGATNAYTDLAPRQPFTATPYAIFAGGASNLVGDLQATQLSGTISASQITGAYTNAVSFNSVSNSFTGTFSGTVAGNGLGLTNLNGSMVTTGTVADARLTTNVAFLNGTQTFSGANTMSNWNNSFTGSFYGNGLVGWNLVPSNSVNAVIDHGYVVTNTYLTTFLLPTNMGGTNIGAIIRITGAGTGGWMIQCTNGQSVIGSFLSYASTLWNNSGPNGVAYGNWAGIACSSDGSRLLAAETSVGVYSSADYGSSWTQTNATTSSWRAVASSADGTKMYAAVAGGGIYASLSGASWSQVLPQENSGTWTSLACSANGAVVVAADYGGNIYTSANSGGSWTDQTASNIRNWSAVACSASGSNIVAAVTNGYLYVSLNGGASWNQEGSSLNWNSVASSADGTHLIAGASNGGVYTSTNSGSAWTQQTGYPVANCNAVASSADGSKLAAAAAGGSIYLSSDMGLTWTVQTNAPATSWCSLAMSADGSHVVAAANTTGTGRLNLSQPLTAAVTTTSANGILYGSQGTSIELQYIGNNQFMPVSTSGLIWAY